MARWLVGSLAWLAGWQAVWTSTGLDKKVRRRKLSGRPHANAMPKQSKSAFGIACRQSHGAFFLLLSLPPLLARLARFATTTRNPLQPLLNFPSISHDHDQ